MQKLTCKDCQAARETQGGWSQHDPLCIYCGARIIQQIQRLPIPKPEKSARCSAMLADWMRFEHSEAAIRALVAGSFPALQSLGKG